MLFKKIEIENIGPINKLDIEFPKTDEQTPKPLVVVGENGSGKTIFLSHLVNTLIAGKQAVFDDVEVEKGMVFKLRSPYYIKSGQKFSFSSVEFDSGEKVQEWQLAYHSKQEFENNEQAPTRPEWAQIQPMESNHFHSTFNGNAANTKKIFEEQCCLYFPVNRFEEPAWLNAEHLKSKASYSELKRIQGQSNREIICTSPLKKNINWLLDVLFDRQVYEIQISNFAQTLPPEQRAAIELAIGAGGLFSGFNGPATLIYNAITQVIRIVLSEDVDSNIRLGAGNRENRVISVVKDEQQWIPNLFQLSTGEVQLINMFVSIIKDYDYSKGELNNLQDIKGIVIIDEIDAHLHTRHQKEILPKLIKSFPNVQFVITTHSPLFLLGMEQEFGEDGFEIINMPNGEQVLASDFSEFVAAYEAFKETATHREEIHNQIIEHAQPILFVEGNYDIRYLNKAAELLGRQEVLERVQMLDGDGYGNLNKIWKSYNSAISEALPNKVILLYDCDTHITNAEKAQVFKRVLPSIAHNPIAIGIENLFSTETIERVEQINPQFIDIQQSTTQRIRNEEVITPLTKSINKDEKGNMCDWLCEHGTVDDFQAFNSVFDVIEETLNY